MPLTPQKKEYQKGLLINTYELPAVESAIPLGIEVLYFDEVKISSFTSQAEFLVRRAAAQEIEASHYIVDGLAAWKILEGGATIKIIMVGPHSKQNTIKLIAYLCNKYQIDISNIVLGFEDKNFILQLKNKLE